MKHILVLKTVTANMEGYGGFKYPESGYVECPDWNPSPQCGSGLHGLPWGVGAGALLSWSWTQRAKWLVLKVLAEEAVEFGGKCKFPRGEVVHCGDQKSATDYLLENGAADKPVAGCYKTGGDGSTLVGGEGSILTGGDRSTLKGGDYSMLTGGRYSTLVGGRYSMLMGGEGSTLAGGDYSSLVWKVLDGTHYRFYPFYVIENGVKPNTPYIFEDGKIQEKVNVNAL